MRQPKILALILATLLAAACLAQTPSQIRSELLQGIKAISLGPGCIPGGVSAFGDHAAPLFVASAGRGVQAPVVSAGVYGKGRVVAFAHNCYFDPGLMTKLDTGKFMANALRWVLQGKSGKVAAIGVSKAFADWLRGQGFQVEMPGRDWARRLNEFAALCMPASAISVKQAGAVARFIQRGGGLVTGDCPWGWLQLHPGKTLAHDHGGQKVLARAGLAFIGSLLGRPGPEGYRAGEVDELAHAGAAFEAILAFTEGRRKLSDAQLKQASWILSATGRSLPPEEGKFRPKLLAAVKKHTQEAVPTHSKPVTVKQPLARLAIVFQYDQWRNAEPEEIKPHPAAKYFPGEVPADAERVTRTIDIDCSVPRWHSTGLYAPPGEVITISAGEDAVKKGLSVQIGCHTDQIWHHSAWRRMPKLVFSKRLQAGITRIASPFGGLIYIRVPWNKSGKVRLVISGAVQAPYFVLGDTPLIKWQEEIRHYPAPWAELANSKVILTVPSKFVRDLMDPELVMIFWEHVMDACADLAQIPRERKSPERYVADEQISAGYMHSGYPIMTHLDAAPRMVSYDKLIGKDRTTNWGLYHEMGHNHQSSLWTFGGTGEVTVNLFSMYVLETVCGLSIDNQHGAVSPENRRKKMERYFAEGPSFDRWKRDPFLALIMYIQLRQAFGWEAYKKVFAAYRELPPDKRPKTDAEKRDMWLVMFSRTVGRNLGPFFEAWGVPTSEKARKSIEDLPVWMPANFPPKVEKQAK